MERNSKIIYLSPDIDISENEGGKSHVLGEIKYLQNYYKKVLLISKNSKNIKLCKEYSHVKIVKIPEFLHKPIFRIWLENIIFIILAIYLRGFGYKYLIERAYRLGGIFSIIFCLFGGKSICQLNYPIYYESYIMPFQNFLIKLMGFFNIKFFGTHETFSYNLPKGKYINGRWGCDPDIINNKKNNIISNKKYDVIYVGSTAKWHSLGNVLNVILNNPQWKFLFITSGHNIELWNKKNKENLNNLIILENIENKEIYKYIKQSKIGLALYEKNSELLKKFDYFYSPIKVHEYKACGLPVIASNIGNLKILVKECGILVNNSVNEIENAIKDLLNNTDKYNKCSTFSIKESIEKYNWNRICKRYFNILSNNLP